MKEWTVMVYLSGDNNLSEECIWSLKEMYRVGLDDRISLVVLIDPRAKRVSRFDIRKDMDSLTRKTRPSALKGAQISPIRNDDNDGILLTRIRKLRKRIDDMASPVTLSDFIRDSRQAHDSKRRLLILSGHGSGAIGDSFLPDGFPPRALSMREVAYAIRRSRVKIDVLGMDACSMGMVETGYQLRNSVDFLIAAEGFELNTGWPYHRVFEALNSKPEMLERELAATIVKSYSNYYSDYIVAGVSTDIAACELRKSEPLAGAVKNLAGLLSARLNVAGKEYVEDFDLPERAIADAIILAHWRAQSYRAEENTDLFDFCELLEKGCSDQEVITACRQVKQAIEGDVQADGTYSGYVIKSCRSGGAFQHSHGVSIYFPWAEFLSEEYSRLDFSKAAMWGKFLEEYTERTRRRPRQPGPGSNGNSHRVAIIDDSPIAIREDPLRGTKSLDVKVPKMKNPPVTFFEDNC